jgi:hypothetical protein
MRLLPAQRADVGDTKLSPNTPILSRVSRNRAVTDAGNETTALKEIT